MPHIQHKEVWCFDELSEKAKDKAREWYREGALEYDWYNVVYESAEQAGKYLGIDLNQTSVKLMNGKTRRDPSIWFTGFYHQGSGSAYNATWCASDVKGETLKADFAQDTELHRLADEFTRIATINPDMTASVKSNRDTSINVDVEQGETADERINALDYKSVEWYAQHAIDKELSEALEETLNDFNHWIYKSLEKEYEWLNADEQVNESIRCNKYEFTEEGSIA